MWGCTLKTPTAQGHTSLCRLRTYIMKTSQAGLDLTKKFEGFEALPYAAPEQIGTSGRTIGYGHVILHDEVFSSLTEEQAEALLAADLIPVERCINNNVDVELTQEQFDALVVFTYNCGNGAFRNSTLLKRLNAGEYGQAADQFLLWDKATVDGKHVVLAGLTRRRVAERSLFLTEVA